jgi:hypothetical protein
MWYYVAAVHHDVRGRLLPDDVAKVMTPEQIPEAQKLAYEWKPKLGRYGLWGSTPPSMLPPQYPPQNSNAVAAKMTSYGATNRMREADNQDEKKRPGGWRIEASWMVCKLIDGPRALLIVGERQSAFWSSLGVA